MRFHRGGSETVSWIWRWGEGVKPVQGLWEEGKEWWGGEAGRRDAHEGGGGICILTADSRYFMAEINTTL